MYFNLVYTWRRDKILFLFNENDLIKMCQTYRLLGTDYLAQLWNHI